MLLILHRKNILVLMNFFKLLLTLYGLRNQIPLLVNSILLKDSNNTIEIRFIGKNQYSSPEEKKCYKLEHLMITTFNSEQHL